MPQRGTRTRGVAELCAAQRLARPRAMTRALLLLLRGGPEPDIYVHVTRRADITNKNTRIVLQNIETACLQKLGSKQR